MDMDTDMDMYMETLPTQRRQIPAARRPAEQQNGEASAKGPKAPQDPSKTGPVHIHTHIHIHTYLHINMGVSILFPYMSI